MNNRYITVKGVGKASTRPDQIVLLMNFEVIKTVYDKAMSCGANTHSVIRNAVIKAGHNEKALKTSDFSITTKYESYRDKDDNWKKRFEGYRYYHSVRLEFDYDLSLLSKTINEIAKSGAVPHIEIKFTIKEPNNMSEKLLESAIENAESNAKVLAKAAGVELGNILRIDYNWSDIHFYSDTDFMSVTSCLKTSDTFHDIEPDDIKANDHATVIWEIK